MSPLRRKFNVAVGVVLLLIPAYCGYNFATAKARVRELYTQIKPGMSLSDFQTFVSEHGLWPRPREGVNYAVESRTFGRWGCKVIVEKGVVNQSEYNFAN